MTVDRRDLLRGIGGASAMLSVGAAAAGAVAPRLPDRRSFTVTGIDLNAAYTHTLGRFAVDAAQAYLRDRATDARHNWPVDNPRDQAVARYAALIGADPAEIAVVPSTLEGENLIGDALGLGPGVGVVTDALHYDASLVRYGERAKRGMPLTVVRPKGADLRFDYDDFARAIVPGTRLVAVSLVTSLTGYRHDLARLCEIAHAKGALVYADVIQAAGAIPLDVRESGVDFACTGQYKWLMGDFGAAFLYVKASALPLLHRVQLGWAGVENYQSHVFPDDPPGPAVGDWRLATNTAGVFEVSTPAWGALAVAAAALDYIRTLGVDAIARHRAPLLDRLWDALTRAGYTPLAPRERHGPALVFGKPGLRERYGAALRAAGIVTTVYRDRIRISPSVHNDTDDIERVIAVLARS